MPLARKGVKCGNLEILNINQIRSIHNSTIRILEKTGVKVLNREALEIYHNNGCLVDFNRKTVRIREEVLMDFVSKAPSTFKLFGKNEDYDLEVDCNTAYLMGGAAAIRLLDLDGVYREPTSTDLNNFTRLQDALENTDIICPMVIPRDIEPEILELHMSAEVMKNTSKNCDLWIHGSPGVKYLIKIAEIITEKKFSERPIFTLCIDLISPLVQPDNVLETMIAAVRRDVPVYVEVCTMMGATSPVTVAGTMVQQSVNILSGIALAQMINEGIPCFYSIASSAMNMNRGGYLAGDPATVLLNAATAQIAHFYNLPFNCGTGLDSKLPDIQAGYERAFQNMGCIAGGGNIVHLGTGMLEQMAMANYELTVVDDEIFEMCKKFFNGVKVDEDVIGEEVIDRLFSINKHEYLSDEHTLKNFTENLWNKRVTDQNSYEVWNMNGRIDALMKAREVAENIIKDYHPAIVDSQKERMINEIVGEAKIKLKENSVSGRTNEQ